MEKQKSAVWDERAWKIGTTGCCLFGILYAAGALSESMVLTPNGKHHFVHDLPYALAAIATIAMNAVLPAILSLLAKRLFLIWGLAPPLFLGTLAITIRALSGQTYELHRDAIVIPAYLILSLMFIIGPISLTRYLQGSTARKQEAAIVAVQSQREAARIPQEGVWPPPPDAKI